MNGTYRKSILDHGGAIVAVPDNVENKDITDVWYDLIIVLIHGYTLTDLVVVWHIGAFVHFIKFLG